MNYELAKELYRAGFPQRSKAEGGLVPVDSKEPILISGYKLEIPEEDRGSIEGSSWLSQGTRWVYVPTLSELIEACGEEFYALESGVKHGDWIAKANEVGIYAEGPTPEEAVAKLWLAINSPSKLGSDI